jgi:hypothetical protein
MHKFLKNLGTRRVTSSKFNAGDLKVLGATVGNLVATAVWPSRGFVRSWPTSTQYIFRNVTKDHENSCSVCELRSSVLLRIG